MRGLPFSATKDDVLEFLDGINVVNREHGIFLIKVTKFTHPNHHEIHHYEQPFFRLNDDQQL